MLSTLNPEPPALLINANIRILVHLVIYDSGQVSLEHLLLSRHPSQKPPLSTVRYHLFVSDCRRAEAQHARQPVNNKSVYRTHINQYHEIKQAEVRD